MTNQPSLKFFSIKNFAPFLLSSLETPWGAGIDRGGGQIQSRPVQNLWQEGPLPVQCVPCLSLGMGHRWKWNRRQHFWHGQAEKPQTFLRWPPIYFSSQGPKNKLAPVYRQDCQAKRGKDKRWIITRYIFFCNMLGKVGKEMYISICIPWSTTFQKSWLKRGGQTLYITCVLYWNF